MTGSISTSAFLSIGFRPFYLGAALFALLAVPLWVAGLLVPGSMLFARGTAGLYWHTHEMVFGFAPAVIVGFLLTAVRNWTGRPTASGYGLAGLFGWWLLGRVLNLIAPGSLFSALIDSSFLPLVALLLAIPLWQSRNSRNAFVVFILLGLGAASLTHSLAIRGSLASLTPASATTLALDLILVLMVVIGGRIIPAFAANAISTLRPRTWLPVETLAIGLPVALLLADLFAVSGAPVRWLLWGAVTVHAVRLAGWQPWKMRGSLLLLVLPIAYSWIPIHLLLRAELPGLATHALTLGAMASLMLAMMSRSALGHTGRPLEAGPAECVCFAAIQLAALARVFGPLTHTAYEFWILAVGGLWLLAFATFAVAYWPILTRPRLN